MRARSDWTRARVVVIGLAFASQWSLGGCGDDEEAPGPGGTGGATGAGGSRSCHNRAECRPGHDCILTEPPGSVGPQPDGSSDEGLGVCTIECIPELCSPRTCQSATGSCGSSSCSNASQCYADEFCAPTRTCRPAAGECEKVTDCLVFNEVLAVADVSCNGQTCALEPKKPALQSAPFPGASNISVYAPEPGHAIDDLESFVFEFDRSDDATILLVLRHATKDSDDLLDEAIWGSVLPAGKSSVTWSDGVEIREGSWQQSPAAAPTSGQFYFLIQAVSQGELTGFSHQIPFSVRTPSKQQGEACEGAGVEGNPCPNPDVVLGCLDGTCHRACAAHAECPNACSDPVNGVRYCN